MDEYRKRLEENADEAEFALMIDDYLNDLGDSLQKKYEEAKRRGEAPEMPEDMKKRLRQFIANYNEPIETTAELAENTLEVVPNKQIAQHSRKWLRRLGVAAATIAILVGSLFTAQAAGIDVFGAIGKWSSDVFHFSTGANSTESLENTERIPVDIIKDTLSSYRLPPELAPSWLPEDFRISELDYSSNDSAQVVYALLENDTGDWVIIRIDCFRTEQGTESLWYQKDAENVEVIEVNNSTFYLTQNDGTWEAMEYCNGCTVSIVDTQGKDAIIQIIQSYGG